MNVDNYEEVIKSLLSASSDGFVITTISPTIQDITVKKEEALNSGDLFVRITEDLTYHRCVKSESEEAQPTILGEYETLKQAVTKFLI